MSEPAALTSKQQEIFDFIRRYIEENGYPPAIRDIGTAFDIKSPNGVMCHRRAQAQRGVIGRGEEPETEGGRARAPSLAGVTGGGGSLPFLRAVAAGKAIEAVEQNEQRGRKNLVC